MTHTTNTPLPKPVPTAFDADDTDGINYAVNRLIQSRAPDTKSQKKAFAVLASALQCASGTNSMMYRARDVLWDISGGFEELCDLASEKHADAKTVNSAIKWHNRSTFYDMLADWASASLDMTENTIGKHQSSPKNRLASSEPDTQLNVDAHSSGPQFDYPKDAEDDSDPYVKTAAPAQQLEPYSLEWAQAKLESGLASSNFSKAQIHAAMNVFNEDTRYTINRPRIVGVCDVLERFGDSCAAMSDDCAEKDAVEDEQFWDACVTLSDELRANIAANTISAKVNYTTPRNEVCHSAEPEDAGQMWEVCGDPHRALFYTKLHAEHWAREMFPTENADKRYARIQYRNVLKFPTTLA